MNWKLTLTSAALAFAALVPTAALADGPHIGVSVNFPPVQVHAHTSNCHHGELPPAPPSGVPQQTGRYELQTVSHYVPGRYEEVVIPGVCHTRHKRHRTQTVCTHDRVERHWVEGRYEQVQQWVWVDYRGYDNGRRYGRFDNDRRYDRSFARRHAASNVR